MADIHSDLESLQKALRIAKDDDVNMVIVAGDLTNVGKKSELADIKKLFDESGVEYYAVPGNHDLWYQRQTKVDIWNQVFDKSFFTIREGGVKYILVNNGDWEFGIGGITESGKNQGSWFKGELEECKKIYCLVVAHEPFNHPTSVHVMGEESAKTATEAAKLVGLMVDSGVKEAIVGHLHYSSSYEFEGLKTTIVGSLSRARGVQTPRFLEMWLENGELKRKEVVLDKYN